MPTTPRCRIVRRAVIAVAVVLLVVYGVWNSPVAAVYFKPITALARALPMAANALHSAMQFSQ